MGKFVAFKAHPSGGVMAAGTVHSISGSHDGKSVALTVRHAPPTPLTTTKKNGGMIDADYPAETRADLPIAAASQFTHGQAVSVHIKPTGKKPAALKAPPPALPPPTAV